MVDTFSHRMARLDWHFMEGPNRRSFVVGVPRSIAGDHSVNFDIEADSDFAVVRWV
jgi:hypothetical protein